uniref:C2H2-type domain-containing protein n=1 Tax=Timema monikensis TaxID=170555 RepID=A0A7R9E2D5_9NEOP|nr:unnamed protein product [Timema monikensis]
MIVNDAFTALLDENAATEASSEDDEWGSDAEGSGDNGGEPPLSEAGAEDVSPSDKTQVTPPTPSAPSPSSDKEDPAPPPRLRLNHSLATDPALRVSVVKDTSPVLPSPAELEYLSSLPPAFHTALATFCLPPLPEVQVPPLSSSTTSSAAGTSRSKQETADNRQVCLKAMFVSVLSRAVPVYMCTPCGIRFSSLSTLEAHQTYYCSHRLKQKGNALKY